MAQILQRVTEAIQVRDHRWARGGNARHVIPFANEVIRSLTGLDAPTGAKPGEVALEVAMGLQATSQVD